MTTDIDLVQAASDIYDDTTSWTQRWNVDDVVVGLRNTAGGDSIISFRGSITADDWFRDFEAMAEKTPLGHVHCGFYDGIPQAFNKIKPLINANVYVTGHSLGAARAWILGAMLVQSGITPVAIVPFAPPRPGFSDFKSLLYASKSILRSYQNVGDPVPDVPLYVPELVPYVQPVLPTSISVAPAAADSSPLRCHHVFLYVEGVNNLAKVTP